MEHKQAFVLAFVVPEKRERYAEFLPKPNRRGEIVRRFSHFFDFIPALVHQVPRGTGTELAPLLRAKGAGETAHIIGGCMALQAMPRSRCRLHIYWFLSSRGMSRRSVSPYGV